MALHYDGEDAKIHKVLMGDFKLRDDELIMVVAPACRLSDEIVRMEGELADAPVMVAGSKGQDRPNPLFAELRAHRLARARLLGQLGLGDAGDADGQERSSVGRKMAHMRWRRKAS